MVLLILIKYGVPKKMKKVIFLLTTAIIITVAGVFFRDSYVYLEESFIERKTEDIDVFLDKVNIKELNRCSNVKSMITVSASDERLSQLTVFENLDTLEILRSKEEISTGGITMINKQPNLKELGFLYSEADFNGISNSSVEKIIISASSVKNLRSIADCGALKKLILNKSVVDNCIIAEENIGNYEEPYNFHLRDSSELLVLNNVEELSLYNIYIEDVSGICEMDSLKSLIVSEGTISDEAIDQLDEKGIKVTQKYNDK